MHVFNTILILVKCVCVCVLCAHVCVASGLVSEGPCKLLLFDFSTYLSPTPHLRPLPLRPWWRPTSHQLMAEGLGQLCFHLTKAVRASVHSHQHPSPGVIRGGRLIQIHKRYVGIVCTVRTCVRVYVHTYVQGFLGKPSLWGFPQGKV